jgi:xanthine dehydrogenase YagS FAD-binding subunit
MHDFEFAAPQTEAEAVALLAARARHAEVLAGGTDLVPLLEKMVVTPQRVVSIAGIASLKIVERDAERREIVLGAAATLDDLLRSDKLADFPALTQAIAGINSPQLQSQGTLGGEICRRPMCWYFRTGHGLLADRGRRVAEGDNRYHAIFGNGGAAKFVHASRIAPALIALGASLRIIGPRADDEKFVPAGDFFRTPRTDSDRENILGPGELVSHVILPEPDAPTNATYEVRQSVGPDMPLAAAAAALDIVGGSIGGIVRGARIALGQVAPIPWLSPEAAAAIVGRPVSESTAESAGLAAVARATPLSDNAYKVQLAKTAVKRAILLAAGHDVGGF